MTVNPGKRGKAGFRRLPNAKHPGALFCEHYIMTLRLNHLSYPGAPAALLPYYTIS